MINKKYTYAIVGASSNEEKYGYKVLKHFLDAGFSVIPINPKGGTILGEKVYESISDIEQSVDVVIFVVPPLITKKVIADVKKNNIKKVWLQPGSESDEVIKFCEENDIECAHGMCIMLEQLKYFT